MKDRFETETRGRARIALLLAFVIPLLVAGRPAAGQSGTGIDGVEVACDPSGQNCRQLTAAIAPESGLRAQLSLRFEEASSLDAGSLDLRAEVVDPDDPELRARLPRDTFVPDDFPVLVQVEPGTETRLSFRRNWTLELVTKNLDFSSHTPFRLFRAPTGGSFEDISVGLGSGSFRVLGVGGSFSEFLIVADLRPVERVVARKVVRLRGALDQLAPDLGSDYENLDGLLDDAVAALTEGELALAASRLDAFVAAVEAASGTTIDDESRPGDQLESASARLLSGAKRLRHSVVLGLESAQGGMSGFATRVAAGGHTVDLRFDLEGAYLADPDDLEISAEIVGAGALSGRLPAGVQVPEEFPVLIRVDPKAGSAQAFGGSYEIEVQTASLSFLGGTPLRLFKAPDGGAFADITDTYGLGSFRVLGVGGSFSELVIAEDLRPVAEVSARKLERLESVLRDHGGTVSADVRSDLETAIARLRQDVEAGEPNAAIARIDALVAAISEAAGEDIPALWRSNDSRFNVAGELTAILRSLKFSLELTAAPVEPNVGDVNLDGQVDVGDVFFLIDRVFGEPAPAPAREPQRPDGER